MPDAVANALKRPREDHGGGENIMEAPSGPPPLPLPPLNRGPAAVLLGSCAELEPLRVHRRERCSGGGDGHAESGSNLDVDADGGRYDDAMEEEEEEVEEELILCQRAVRATMKGEFCDVAGGLYVTTRRVLFVADACDGDEEEKAEGIKSGDTSNARDLAIDAGCIALHALSSSAEVEDEGESGGASVYCQLTTFPERSDDAGARGLDTPQPDVVVFPSADQTNEDGENDGGPTEVVFSPIDENEEACQHLFKALSRMASLNPVEDDDGDGGAACGGIGAMLSMMGGGFGDADDDDGGDEMVCRIGNGDADDDNESAGATEEEREAMLRRLDAMLVVPPEYELSDSSRDEEISKERENSGQFDDAEEDDDLL